LGYINNPSVFAGILRRSQGQLVAFQSPLVCPLLYAKICAGIITNISAKGNFIWGKGKGSLCSQSHSDIGFLGQPRCTIKREFQLPPIVYVDAPQFSENTILLDLEGSGFKATTHLLEHGHRRIGMITAPLSWPNFNQAYQGYLRALKASKLELDPALVIEAPIFALESGYLSAMQMLELKNPPTGIFVSGDLMATGAIRALNEHGKRVPKDIAIVSKDNIELAAQIDPPLTTVASPTYQMGVEAMNMLIRLIAGKRLDKKRIVMPTELIVRKSCGCI